METEKEFCFIITQKISRMMTKAKLSEKMYNFLNEQKKDLMRDLKLPENRIHTGSYYDCDNREFKGVLRIQKNCTENHIDQINNQNKAIWTMEDCEPYTISCFHWEIVLLKHQIKIRSDNRYSDWMGISAIMPFYSAIALFPFADMPFRILLSK